MLLKKKYKILMDVVLKKVDEKIELNTGKKVREKTS